MQQNLHLKHLTSTNYKHNIRAPLNTHAHFGDFCLPSETDNMQYVNDDDGSAILPHLPTAESIR